MIKSLWKYRGFIVSSISNELIARFTRSKLGALWIVIHPFTQVAIYVLILSNVLSAKLPGVYGIYSYAIYLMAGLLCWTLFSEILTRCLTLFIEQGNLIKKMNFPKITLPVIVVGSCLMNNFFLFLAILVALLLLGQPIHIEFLWLLPVTIILVIFSLGLGLTLGVLNIFIRDVGHVIPIVLQMLFWLTPIVYPVNIIPEGYRYLLSYNPLYSIVTAYQDILLRGLHPQLDGLLVVTVVAIVLAVFALILFRRASGEMVDVL